MKKQRGSSSETAAMASLVGVWRQAPNRRLVTSVIYRIELDRGRFRVRAMDEEDGVALKISRVKWDGESLRFASTYSPMRHRANHVLTLLSKKRMRHEVSGVFADTGPFAEKQVWIRKREKKSRWGLRL